MNKIIKKQLEAVTATKINFTDNSSVITIPKTVKILNSSIKIGKVYDIELNDSVLEGPASKMLSSNWNNGFIPKYKHYMVEIIGNMSKMVKINGVAKEDNTSQFYGWLPNDGFTITKRYE